MFIRSIPCKPTKSSVSDASGACHRACSGCVHMPSTDSRAIEKVWKATILGSWNTYLSMPSQLLKNDAPLYEVIYPTKLLVQPVLVAAQDLKVMLELTRVWRNREIAREPVLRDLPPPLLVGVELYQARGLLANTGNIVEMQDGGVHGGSNRNLRFGLRAIVDACGGGRDRG